MQSTYNRENMKHEIKKTLTPWTSGNGRLIRFSAFKMTKADYHLIKA